MTDTPANPPTIFVVDDDDAMRESLEFLFRSAGRPCRSFPTAEAFAAFYQPAMPGCVLLDVRMPGMSGLELQEKLRARQIGIPVIILTAHGDIPMAVRAMRAGAMDFIEKPSNDQVLLERIARALEHDAEHRIDDMLKRDAAAKYDRLSPREKEVMELVVAGMLNKQIASALDISIKTVEVHRNRVMEKMEASSLADLVRMSILLGIE